MKNALLKLVLPVIDVILPERMRAARVRTKNSSDFQLMPVPHNLLGERIVTLLDYRDVSVSDLVWALKYERSGHAARICAELLADYLREEIASLRAFSPRPVFLIPMPLHPKRIQERGFNQMERVLQYLPSEFKDGSFSRLAPERLSRIKETAQQARLSRSERIKNVSDAFSAAASLGPEHVILVDDVATTGATLRYAAEALRNTGARVSVVSLARA